MPVTNTKSYSEAIHIPYTRWLASDVKRTDVTVFNFPVNDTLINDEANMDWVKDYGVLLLVEYGQRTNLRHMGSQYIFDFVEDFGAPIGVDPIGFLNRAWDERFDYRFEHDTPTAYKKLMSARWAVAKRSPHWGDRMPPVWYLEDQLQRQGVETH